jgi:outer membrane protein OmpA-like peptidoglycan-associated protein
MGPRHGALLSEKKVSNMKDLLPLLEVMAREQKPLLMVADSRCLRFWYGALVGGSLALGTSCASFHADAPPAASPGTAMTEPAAQTTALSPTPASAPPVEVGAAAHEMTGKPLKWLDGLSSNSRENDDEPGTHASPADFPDAAPYIFAERRSSESLDQLAETVDIRREKRGAIITLACDKLVDPGQWALNAQGRSALGNLSGRLREQDGHTILIQAYTDSLGSSAVNDALSLRRAEAVRDYLMAQGVPADRLRAEGFGARRPVAVNSTSEGRTRNRRIEIVISP